MTPSAIAVRIRDGIESDIPACLALDHRFETDYVWQMSLTGEGDSWQITFNRQRLPRTLETLYPADERRLRLSLPPEQCFLVMVRRDEPEILGYLTMSSLAAYDLARIHDLVISYPYRRHGLGTRLLKVARQWAREHDLGRLVIETRTQNYPAIVFCQQAGFQFSGYDDQYFPNRDIAVFFSQSLS